MSWEEGADVQCQPVVANMIPAAAASASPGNCQKSQFLGPNSDLLHQKLEGEGGVEVFVSKACWQVGCTFHCLKRGLLVSQDSY